MRVRLLDPDHDLPYVKERGRFHPQLVQAVGADDVVTDLQLEPLLNALGSADDLHAEVTRAVLLARPPDATVVRYRQEILADCLANPGLIDELYQLAGDALKEQAQVFRIPLVQRAEARLEGDRALLQLLLVWLARLHELGRRAKPHCASTGLQRFFADLVTNLDQAYLDEVSDLLGGLGFHGGLVLSGELGEGQQGTGYLVRVADRNRGPWWHHTAVEGPTNSFTIPPRDDASAAALADLLDAALSSVAEATSEALESVLATFVGLRLELAFYLGCVRLHQLLARGGVATCRPTIAEEWSATDLVDPVLALMGESAVGNTFDSARNRLVVITGLNGGGKSTMLRAIGIAALMARSGMFVAASSATTPVFAGVQTHFRHAEDDTMRHGKFDEELRRMSELIDHVEPGDLVLCNESFASTDEREGSQVGAGVVQALIDSGVAVVLVTHLYTLAELLDSPAGASPLFLRADPGPDGTPTFALVPGRARRGGNARRVWDQVMRQR